MKEQPNVFIDDRLLVFDVVAWYGIHSVPTLRSLALLAVPSPWLTAKCLECGHYGGLVNGGLRLLATLFQALLV